MSRIPFLFGLSILGLVLVFSQPGFADALIRVGDPCQQLGVSAMTSDQKDIAVCLKDDAGLTKWKASTGSGGSRGSICGYALISNSIQYYNQGKNQMSRYVPSVNNILPCNGQGVLNPSTFLSTCPTGYSAFMFPPSGSSLNADGSNPSAMAFCIKS